jgi:acyl-CoA synthetase (NDP forming)
VVPELECDREEGRAVVREAVAAGGAWLDAEQTRRLLAAYGVPLVPERVAATKQEAVEAANELGFPVVLKTAAPGAHKTEQGGIALDLADEAAVLDAAERIGAPLLVQPFVRGGAELLAGAVQDPVFGPLVAFGPGGVLAELIGEAQFRLAPLTGLDAEELVHSGKAGRLVAGFRGTPPADQGALVDLLLRLSLLVEELPEVVELDLNPVLGLPDRCLAVDARVRVAEHGPAHRTKSW